MTNVKESNITSRLRNLGMLGFSLDIAYATSEIIFHVSSVRN